MPTILDYQPKTRRHLSRRTWLGILLAAIGLIAIGATIYATTQRREAPIFFDGVVIDRNTR